MNDKKNFEIQLKKCILLKFKKNASKSLKNDIDFILNAVSIEINNYKLLQYMSKKLKNNKQFMMKAVEINGYCLKYASENLKNDKEVVFGAMETDMHMFEYASDDLKNDKKIVLEAIEIDETSFCWSKFNLDRDVCLKAAKHGFWFGNITEDEYRVNSYRDVFFVSYKNYPSDNIKCKNLDYKIHKKRFKLKSFITSLISF